MVTLFNPHLRQYLADPSVLTSLLNPLFDPNPSMIMLTVSPLTVTLWKRLYLKTSLQYVRPPSLDALKQLKDSNVQLREKLGQVRE